jgi:hypothetical protein
LEDIEQEPAEKTESHLKKSSGKFPISTIAFASRRSTISLARW